MYSTGPASIALTELTGGGINTYHFKDNRDFVRAILRNRPYFDLIAEEIVEAEAVWAESDARDNEPADDSAE